MSPRPTARKDTLFQRFARNRRGVSAVEFALIAPVMILSYFGMGELCEAMMAQRRVSHIASALGDLTAQAQTIHDTDMTDIFSAAGIIATPFPTTTLQMRVTSITGDSSGTPKVDWSSVQGMTALTKGSTVTGLPTGLIAASGDSIIMAESKYSYAAPSKYVLPNGLNFSEVFYLRPRKSAQVTRVSP